MMCLGLEPRAAGLKAQTNPLSPPRSLISYLQRVFLWCQKSLIVPPPFDQREPARLARGVRQRVDDVLKERTTMCEVLKSRDNIKC